VHYLLHQIIVPLEDICNELKTWHLVHLLFEFQFQMYYCLIVKEMVVTILIIYCFYFNNFE